MKTEKFYTKRKVDENLLGFINHIREFTYTELYEILRNSKDPLIYAVNKNEYALGRYFVIRENDFWKVVTHLGDVDHVFSGRNPAIIYALLLMQNNLKLANKIAKTDETMLCAKAEVDLYIAKLRIATKVYDDFKAELYAAKLSNCRFKHRIAKEELEKTLNMAKYLKLGT
jgi:hypothetical protein